MLLQSCRTFINDDDDDDADVCVQMGQRVAWLREVRVTWTCLRVV